MDNAAANLAIYIHWPYCTRICPYCDFNVYKAKKDERLVDAILDDLTNWRERSGPRRIVSIHFGGGTPSLLAAENIAQIIDHCEVLWGVGADTEIAIEANPNNYSKAEWAAAASAGINRLSLGVQSFHGEALSLLGRDHDAPAARQALENAVSLFRSVSVDLIFGWAGQTPAQWAFDLDCAVDSGASHISTYQLTIEAGTAFDRMEARGQRKSVSETENLDFYQAAIQRLTQAGFEHYEVSNFGKPGHASRHNLAYWTGDDYVGVGPGAHGRLTIGGARVATIAAMRPEDYQTRVAETGSGIADEETLSPDSWAEESVLMGLRISRGLSLNGLAEKTGQRVNAARLAEFVNDGYLRLDGDRLSAAPKGRLVLNYITEKLLLG